MGHSSKVAEAFSNAAKVYDQYSLIQTYVSQRLSHAILKEETSLGVALEIGCGTGILSQHLVSYAESYILTDISFALLSKARTRICKDHVHPLVVNGEYPCFTASFDVIVSNLALHWFPSPKSALTRLIACLKPGGRLYLSALGNNSFHEWRTAHALAEAPCGILDFISCGQLKNWLPVSGERWVEEEWVTLAPQNALEFLRGLKNTGGSTPHPAYEPLPYKTFRKIMKIYDQDPLVSCQILYGIYRKSEKMREE